MYAWSRLKRRPILLLVLRICNVELKHPMFPLCLIPSTIFVKKECCHLQPVKKCSRPSKIPIQIPTKQFSPYGGDTMVETPWWRHHGGDTMVEGHHGGDTMVETPWWRHHGGDTMVSPP
ncbi:hypothetical protein KUCAC02_037547 [Chaenocephalus aceratus]|nr:hypothetical protein KUCAC02_037547 [Chaenocephalus aceratus]